MSRYVHGEGPKPADVCVVGSEPGWKEVRSGHVFVGPTGDELNRLLSLVGLSRSRVFLTNLYREEKPDKKTPHTAEQRDFGLNCLRQELAEVRPRLIIPLGREASRLFMGDVDMDEVFGLHLKGLLCVACSRPLPWSDFVQKSGWSSLVAGNGQRTVSPATVTSGLTDATSRHIDWPTRSSFGGSMHPCKSTISAETSAVSIPGISNQSVARRIYDAGMPAEHTANVGTPSVSTTSATTPRVTSVFASNVVESVSDKCVCECGSRQWREVSIAPQVHPAAGFHSPEASSQTLVGFEELRRILKGEIPARGLYDDPYPEPDYIQLAGGTQVANALPCGEAVKVAVDTEGYLHRPWSWQATLTEGSAMLVRAGDDGCHSFRQWLEWERPQFWMHAGLHDIGVLRQMGIDVIELGLELHDTQLLAYLLNVLPQGLKPLATRELGMRMLSYQEVLGDAQDRHARNYLQRLWEQLNAERQALREEDFQFQLRVAKRRIKVLPEHPKSNLLKAVERCLGSAEPFRLWDRQVIDLHVEAHTRMGEDVPEASLSDVDPATALAYSCRDSDATFRLSGKLLTRARSMGLESVYRLDIGTYPMLDRMMQVGIRPDLDAARRLAGVLDGELDTLRRNLQATTGEVEFNANSGDQVAEYLYGTLGLEPLGKLTSSGRGSTNDKVLEALEKAHRKDHPEIADIRAYREYYKLRWTFVERLPEYIEAWPWDGRIHCELMLTRTPSGRLAAKNPNLLAMPKHGKFAKAFRNCFVPGPGRLFLSADESQVELRVGAHLSQDPVMLAIYRGEKRNPDGSLIDLHAAMVERTTGKKPKDQTSADRTAAKAINFGYWMGQTAVGLCLECRKAGLDMSEDDAQRWIDEANKLYVGAEKFKQACVREAQQNGYVRCLSGRIRYIGGIRSKDERVRAEAERFAYSTKIQEGAQWIAKQVLASAWRDIFCPLRRAGHWIEPILWIHDDLLSEMEADLVLEVAPRLKRCMETAPPGFSVPLVTEPEAGLSWSELVAV